MAWQKGKSLPKEMREKISNSLRGNKNAEKFDKETVVNLLELMIQYCTSEYEVVVKKKDESNHMGDKQVVEKVKRNVHLKKKILMEFELWNPDWFSDIKTKFSNDKTVLRLLSCIDMICEVNTYEDAANQSANPVIAKMNLATHYGWADASKVETKESKDLTDEEIEEQLKAYNKRNK